LKYLAIFPRKVDFSCFGYHPYLESRLTIQEKWVLDKMAFEATRGRKLMSDAQLGLLTATPIIIVFAGALSAMAVLSIVPTVSSIGLSIAIALVLFTTQKTE